MSDKTDKNRRALVLGGAVSATALAMAGSGGSANAAQPGAGPIAAGRRR